MAITVMEILEPMKRKIQMKMMAALICFLVLILLAGLAVEILIRKRSDVMTVCIAAHDIAPRTRITENDIAEIQVSAAYIETKAYIFKEDIIGKYTDIQGMIPAGSPFYMTMLKEEDELPDFAALQLQKGQTSFILDSESDIAESLTAGQRVDVYFSGEVNDILFEHARIIALRDENGYLITDMDSSGQARKIEIAIAKSDASILESALKKGQITFHAIYYNYETMQEALLVRDSAAVLYLEKDSSD